MRQGEGLSAFVAIPKILYLRHQSELGASKEGKKPLWEKIRCFL